MSSPNEDELSHPLEQETGEKDVPPEEEGAEPQSEEADTDSPGTGEGAAGDAAT
ncbi:hypothetical protein [Streptomyces sp. NPDC053367]|uniref:hypothetical protein n=1 Tax=Streptomyces sp. NPDC053367 TaxID=3365700 RepID=UPI0037CD648E